MGPDPQDFYYPVGTSTLQEFINNPHGHEIMEVIDATASGVFSSFYIKAPGYFDTSTGLFETDLGLVDGNPLRTPQSTLFQINQHTAFPESLSSPDAKGFELGRCINLTL